MNSHTSSLQATMCRHAEARTENGLNPGHEFRWLVGFIATCFLSTSIATAQTTPIAQPLTLEAAFTRALAVNPTIVAARLRRNINLAGLAVATERLNPEARVELERETPTRTYSLAVPLELGGKRGRRIAVAEATILTGEAELAQTIIQIRSDVRRAYFRQVIAEARRAVWDEVQQFASRARDAAQQRFEAGSTPRLEVLQAQLALAQAENEAIAAQATARAASVQLNALLAPPLDVRLALSTPIGGVGVVPMNVALTKAQAANTELAVLDRRIGEQRARLALAQALRVPDVTPEATLTRGAEPEFTTGWRAAVSVTIPVFTSHRAGVRVEEAALTQLNVERNATLARITGVVNAAATVAEAERLQYVRFRDQILPQAQEVERMAQDSYMLGQTGIAALLQALQASRDVRLRSLQVASDLQDALADLERAIGVPIP